MKKYRWLIFSALSIAALLVLFIVFDNSNRSSKGEGLIESAFDSKKQVYQNDWQKYVTAQVSGGYQTGFGGFKGITIQVTNEMPYNVDHVQVTVDYIKSNGESYKTETVDVYNLAPDDQETVQAPDSPRGKKLKVKVTGISSTVLSLNY